MKFADSSFLVALTLIIIPILIHFLHFKRYKTVYFSQVGFLQTLLNESRKKNKLKQLIMLLCRIMTITAIVLAFAQPYIPLNSTARLSGTNAVGIYIDNSFSMNSQGGKGMLLESAKAQAIDLARSFSPGTNFMLLTNDADPKQRLSLNREQLITRIGQIKSSATAMTMSKAVQILQNEMETQFPKAASQVFLLSDFQQRFSDLGKLAASDHSQVYLLPFRQPEANNLLVDTCWLNFPGRLSKQTETVTIRITNQSGKASSHVPLRLYVNDSLKALTTVNLKAGESLEKELSYQNQAEGIHNCRVELDDYPVTYDNTFYFSYETARQVNTLIISEQGEKAAVWLRQLLEDSEQIRLDEMPYERLQLSRLTGYQCIYLLNLPEIPESLQGTLSAFVENGGSLVVFPGEEPDPASYNRFFSRLNAATIGELNTSTLKIDQLNLQNHLLHAVFTQRYDRLNLPEIRASYRMVMPVRSLSSAILTNNDGSVALRESTPGQGRLYQFNFPLTAGATNFYQHPLFVPVIYNMALHSYFPQTIQYRVQNNASITLHLRRKRLTGLPLWLQDYRGSLNVQLTAPAGSDNQLRFNPDEFIRTAGFYHIKQEQETIAPLAFNYNRDESDTSFYSLPELNELADTKGAFQVYNTATPDWLGQYNAEANLIELWKYFLLLALFSSVAELLIIRFWK
jgi:hypothetical protein